MTKLEKYKEAILLAIREFGDIPAVVGNELAKCEYNCEKCDLDVRKELRSGNSCVENFFLWLAEEEE